VSAKVSAITDHDTCDAKGRDERVGGVGHRRQRERERERVANRIAEIARFRGSGQYNPGILLNVVRASRVCVFIVSFSRLRRCRSDILPGIVIIGREASGGIASDY